MKTKRSHEGYFQLDHRDSPGLPDELLQRLNPGMPLGAGRGNFEAPVVKCNHCQFMIVLDLSRAGERGHCRKCDHYICNPCNRALVETGICKPFTQIIDEVQEAAAQAELIKEV